MSINDPFASPDSIDSNPLSTSKSSQHLRWWPAAVLVVSMFALRFSPALVESPTLPHFMAAFLGPAALGILILVWWISISRASVKEKAIGFFSVVIIGIVACIASHKSMRDMNLMFYVIPTGTGFFAAALILFAKNFKLRLPIAIIASMIGFGAWGLLRSEGVTGKFAPNFAWRWEPSAEDKFNAGIQGSEKAITKKDDTKIRPVKLENSPWPAFRGKDRDGKIAGAKLEEDWIINPPKLIWKIEIGPGWGSFAIGDDLLFTQEQRGSKEAVICLSAQTGERLWIYEYPSRFEETVAGAGPRATPTIADEGLFSLGANGILVCLEAHTGKSIWSRDIQIDAGRTPPTWGFSSSPLVTEGVVIVHAGGSDDKGLLAYDAKSGDLKWKVASGDHSYSSAQLATFSGVSGVLMETNFGLQFLNPKDGKEIWSFEAKTPNYRTLQPSVIEESVLLATSLGDGTKRIKISRDGDKWTTTEMWKSRDLKPDFNDFVVQDGFIYGFDGNIFSCINLEDGKRKWKKGRYGSGQVLLLPDAGQMLVTSEAGELVLLKADSAKLTELGKIEAIAGKTWNHSVLIGDKVYIRNGAEAACYQLSTQ